MLPRPRAHIPAIQPYQGGRPIEEVQREYGLDSVIKLASNENPLGPSPKAVQAMVAAAGEMNQYPDGNGYYLKSALSKKYGVAAERIVLGNGSDEINGMVAAAYLGPEANAVFSQHDFISYKLECLKAGAPFTEVPLRDWRCDPRGLAAAVDANTRVVFVANPSNPVGTMIARKELETLLASVPESVLVFLDEAYFEYVGHPDYPDGVDYLERHPNLVVARTFSKAYGLAGLRVGYAFAHPEVIGNLDRVRKPFDVSRMAQAAAQAALGDAAHLRRSRATNDRGRAALEAGLAKLGLSWIPGVCNFILADLGCPAAPLNEALLRLGVIVRPVAGYGLPNHLRVTIGTAEENRRFLAALRKVLD